MHRSSFGNIFCLPHPIWWLSDHSSACWNRCAFLKRFHNTRLCKTIWNLFLGKKNMSPSREQHHTPASQSLPDDHKLVGRTSMIPKYLKTKTFFTFHILSRCIWFVVHQSGCFGRPTTDVHLWWTGQNCGTLVDNRSVGVQDQTILGSTHSDSAYLFPQKWFLHSGENGHSHTSNARLVFIHLYCSTFDLNVDMWYLGAC